MVLEKANKMLVDDNELLDESKYRKEKSSEFLEESRIQEQVRSISDFGVFLFEILSLFNHLVLLCV